MLMAFALVAASVSCADDLPELQEELNLTRCLVPTELSAKISNGQDVQFNWTKSKGATLFVLELYNDENMTDLFESFNITLDELPYSLTLEADKTFYGRVKAVDETGVLQDSKWAEFEKAIQTTAVKPNMFLEFVAKTSESVTVKWEATDNELERIEWAVGETVEQRALTTEEIAAGQAVVTGLKPATSYTVSIWFKSANRGEVVALTDPNLDGYTQVADLASLQSALAAKAPKIFVKLAEVPYELGAYDLTAGVEMVGEQGVDGSRPVIYGEFHIADGYDGKAIRFETVELNGQSEKFGFALQLKNGGTTDKTVESILFKNCNITGYSKGLFYEWGKTLTTDRLAWDGCVIWEVNKTHEVGGDGIDFRGASNIKSLEVINSTIYNGFRTFLRIDANPVIGDLKVENNTFMKVSYNAGNANTNNSGMMGIKGKPTSSATFKNNLVINMPDGCGLTRKAGTNLTPAETGMVFSNNHFYNVGTTFFSDTDAADQNNKVSQAEALAGGGSILSTDPCYNAKGGVFNLTNAELISAKVGAPQWQVTFVEKEEDLTLACLEGAHTWDFSDAKYFTGTIEKHMVRDYLYMGAKDVKLAVDGGAINFSAASVTKKNVPSDGYVAFKVAQPGSVYINATDPEGLGNHLVVAVGPVDGSSAVIKGGAVANVHNTTNQKILISDITEESLVYVYATGPIGLSALAWALDLKQVNTALDAPVPTVDVESFTAGEGTDINVTWEPVENAGSYSVVFMGKTYAVEATDAPVYVVEAKTTGMLEAGSYKVDVYANPAEGDIYNTMSNAGSTAFAVLPKASAGDSELFVVKDSESLLAAIDAGKTEIYLAEGSYDIGKQLTVIAPLALIGQGTVNVNGAFVLSGEVGTFKVSNINFTDAEGAGCFITLPEDGVTATEVVVENAVLDGFSKSVIYGNYATANIDKVVIDGVQTKNWGTGQGIFDFRKGTYGSIIIRNSTITGGRDLLRLDSACATGEVLVMHNTLDAVNNGVNGNGLLYVRASVADYKAVGNLFLNQTAETKNSLSKTSGVAVPYMAKNFFYNCADVFFSGLITKEIATGNNGVILETDPVKDSANGDYTLTSALAMSCRVGAPKWNPSYAAGDDTCFTVTSADEFQAAIDAGKTDIKFAVSGSPYDLTASNIEIKANMHINGEAANGEYPVIKIKQIDLLAGVESLVFENLAVEGDGSNNIFNVKEAIAAKQIVIRNNKISKAGKSLYYDSVGGAVTSLVIRNNVMTELGGGQGTIDIRKGSYVNVSVENNTVVGGRDFIRADKTTVTGGINIDNNTFDGVTLNHGNGMFHVRAAEIDFFVRRNLFLNENGENNLLAKAGDQVPVMAGNFYYNCTSETFYAGAIDQATATGNGGVILTADPVKDAVNGDYTLVDALCLSSNVGAARWNPNAGRVTTEMTVSNLEELITALDAGKTTISLNAGTYDFTAAPETATSFSSGVLTINTPLVLKGISKAGVKPVIVGSIKFTEGVTSFTAQGLAFNGNEQAIGNAFEVGGALAATNIIIRDCEIYAYKKSLFYGNAEGTVDNLTFNRLLVHDMGTGQGMIDIRKKLYAAVVIENSTFYDGGRDFIRLDGNGTTTVKSASIRNNTFSAVSIDASNSILYVRSADLAANYVVENNLFLNETGEKTILAKAGTQVPVMKNNWFYNCTSAAFWTGTIDQATATANGGVVVEADPCTDSANGSFKLADANLKNAKVGDPRWW